MTIGLSTRANSRPTPLRSSAWLTRRPYLALIVLCLFFFLPGLTTLPPLDRDESRFAQASKQMLETGDFIEIRFQGEARNKKPVGIHWLQAASTAVLGHGERNQIWTYRIPSVLGAMAAVLLVFGIGQALVGREAALIAAGLLGSTLLVTGEANIAKTDAVLLATTVGTLCILGRAYVAAAQGERIGVWTALGFWTALGLGVLIKGPIVPVVALLTILALAIADRRTGWLLQLRPLRGLVLLLAIVLPWGIAVWLETAGEFYREAAGVDFLPKLVGQAEQHGGPLGYYAMLAHLTFWPAAVFLVPALAWGLAKRREPAVRFLLAWAIPTFVMFELVPTKLPHYVLPTYPALALLAAHGLLAAASGDAGARSRYLGITGKIGIGFFVLVGLFIAVATSLLPVLYGAGLAWTTLPFSALIAAALLVTAAALLSRELLVGAGSAIATAAITAMVLLEVTLPKLTQVDLSRQIAAAVARHETDPGIPVATTGYREPSLIFLLGTETRLRTPDEVADHLAENPQGLAIVEGRELAEFEAAAAARGVAVERLERIEGLNYSRGDESVLDLYRRVP